MNSTRKSMTTEEMSSEEIARRLDEVFIEDEQETEFYTKQEVLDVIDFPCQIVKTRRKNLGEFVGSGVTND